MPEHTHPESITLLKTYNCALADSLFRLSSCFCAFAHAHSRPHCPALQLQFGHSPLRIIQVKSRPAVQNLGVAAEPRSGVRRLLLISDGSVSACTAIDISLGQAAKQHAFGQLTQVEQPCWHTRVTLSFGQRCSLHNNDHHCGLPHSSRHCRRSRCSTRGRNRTSQIRGDWMPYRRAESAESRTTIRSSQSRCPYKSCGLSKRNQSGSCSVFVRCAK